MSEYIKDIHTDYLQIDTPQMIEVDRLMMEEYHIELIQMMENAGRCLAILTRERIFQGDVENRDIVVLAGTGGNGGGAMVAARRLHGWGAKVHIAVTSNEEQFTPIPGHQYKILKQMGLPIGQLDTLDKAVKPDAIVDGIIGYSLKGNPYGQAAEMISWANSQNKPIISLDTPSGLDLTTGTLFNPVVKATATLTLAMPKVGLFQDMAKKVTGELYLGDISVPTKLYQEKSLGLKATNIFRFSDVVRII
ncbi:MAG: NAD(P)H-hydrate epimerase [Bacteroidota bacterium]